VDDGTRAVGVDGGAPTSCRSGAGTRIARQLAPPRYGPAVHPIVWARSRPRGGKPVQEGDVLIVALAIGLDGGAAVGLPLYLLGVPIVAALVVSRIRRRLRGVVSVSLVLAVAFLALAATCTGNSLRWIGTTFPGFFVMANRVIPAAGLTHWTGVAAGEIYHRAVLEVNGRPPDSSAEIYREVEARPPETRIEYMMGAGDNVTHRVIPSMTFELGDYVWLFVPYLLNGILFAAAGLAVWALKPYTDASWAMLGFGCCVGVFALTAADLYGPHWFYRLHITAEAFLPATFVHLAMAFPENHLRGRRRLMLTLLYGPALALAAAHQWFYFVPARYSLIYVLCSACLGGSALALIGSVAHAYRTTTSHLLRQRVRVLLIGTITAAGPAALLMGASGLSGGGVPVNAVAFTAFVFPLTLAYSIVKHDLFAIDALVKRAVYYVVLTGAVFVLYALVITVLDLTVHRETLVGSAAYALVLSLAVVLLFDPVKARAKLFVDRVCFRRVYDPEKVLQATSQALASTPHLTDVLDVLLGTTCTELHASHAYVYLREGDGALKLARGAGNIGGAASATIERSDPVLRRVAAHHGAFSVYDMHPSNDASTRRSDARLFTVLGVDIFLPLRFRSEFVGLLALGPKQSGAFYTAGDADFLGTLSAQSVVSILHAMAYQRIEDLNRELEQKVLQRTAELAQANGELTESLGERERAYVELQRRQEQLLHAEKMAALGRLTAGIAHEISTPLGAALSALKVITDVAQEYRAAAESPATEPEDHREMAKEITEVSAEAVEWTQKAARFVRNIKINALGREELHEREFSLPELIEETYQLLAHRIRLCECSVQVSVAPDTPALFGDPQRLGQVLTNLITNALDAYRETPAGGGLIRIVAGPEDGNVVIRVSDDGPGIHPEHLQRIFEELFTTKPPGLGTGLGLSISQGILSDCFGGRIEVDSEIGRGTTFTITLPVRRPRAEDADAQEAELQ
jgi:signal transduction histidine kinase